MSNVQLLKDFIRRQVPGTVLNLATSQYADNTTAKDFHFDYYSTAQAVRSLINSGLISGDYRWRYYEVTVK